MNLSFDLPYRTGRSPVIGRNVVATSQPLAVQAGVDALRRGGSAVDAALAAAITLVTVEPTGNGLGSDAFAIVWDGRLHGLNASGRAPQAWSPARFDGLDAMPNRGWDSVTVPGAVSAWVALHERFGRLPFESLFEQSIHYAREGFPVSPIIAGQWARIADDYADQAGFAEAFLPDGRPPAAGETFRLPALATSLEKIAGSKGDAFYRGGLAETMVAHASVNGGALSLKDLAHHAAEWCGTLAQGFGDLEVHEIPPNGQGIATLLALGILRHFDLERESPDSAANIHLQIEAMKLAFADVHAHLADPAAMKFEPTALLNDAYLADRAALIDPDSAGAFDPGEPAGGGTVFVAAADSDGMMVSYIQSNYQGFGSGVVVPETGISLQDRGAGFSLKEGHPNQVAPGKRPFNTIIPGFAMAGNQPAMAFGVMGGPMQAQGHLQMVLRTLFHRQNPQAAADAPRWQVVAKGEVALEAGMPEEVVAGLVARGHAISETPLEASWAFGGAQLIFRTDEGYIAGSDHRKDGHAAAF